MDHRIRNIDAKYTQLEKRHGNDKIQNLIREMGEFSETNTRFWQVIQFYIQRAVNRDIFL